MRVLLMLIPYVGLAVLATCAPAPDTDGALRSLMAHDTSYPAAAATPARRATASGL